MTRDDDEQAKRRTRLLRARRAITTQPPKTRAPKGIVGYRTGRRR